MPQNSFIIVDDSIPLSYWSKDEETYLKVERLRLFLAWMKKTAKILKMGWIKFKTTFDEKDDGTDNVKRLIKEVKENTKSFVSIQNFIEEDGNPKDNLIQLAKSLTPLGKVKVVSDIHGEDNDFNFSIGKAEAYTIEQFNDLVNRDCKDFYNYIGEEYFDSSA